MWDKFSKHTWELPRGHSDLRSPPRCSMESKKNRFANICMMPGRRRDLPGCRKAARQSFSTDAPAILSIRRWWRSEEHTSELQSLRHLVCRLLLEKKKQNKTKQYEYRLTCIENSVS